MHVGHSLRQANVRKTTLCGAGRYHL